MEIKKRCPVCGSTKISQTPDKLICNNCGYIHEDYGFAQDRKEIKEKRYKQGGSLRTQKR